MKHLLVGNGINIQFDNKNYTSQQIMLRILKNCDQDDFPAHVIIQPSYLLKNYFGQLFLEAREVIIGNYDKYATCTAEREAIIAFRDQYDSKISSLRITDIGLEDYYLIHDLFSHKMSIHNPEQFNIREAMKLAYFYAIYNDGSINSLYTLYPEKFINYLKGFDSIYTTNYDSNIESATSNIIYHIHGQFDKVADIYNPDSFRNQLPDMPIKDFEIDDRYPYLYCNALSTYCGAYKQFQINQNSSANNAIDKFAQAYISDPEVKKQIDSWCYNTNRLLSNMGHAIQLKAAHPELCFSENYHFDKFKAITGELTIIGLSPWNDFHIFESINNATIEKCKYYYFSDIECERIERLLPELYSTGKLEFKSVNDFWSWINEN